MKVKKQCDSLAGQEEEEEQRKGGMVMGIAQEAGGRPKEEGRRMTNKEKTNQERIQVSGKEK